MVAVQKDVKKAVDANAYPRVSADIRHHIGTLRYSILLIVVPLLITVTTSLQERQQMF